MNHSVSMFRIVAAVIMYLTLTSSAQAATYYVRTDGGSATQCTGTSDVPYSGSGTNQACAFSHPFWAISVAGTPNKMVGGDTLIIGPGQYMMGFGAANTSVCSSSWPWECRMRAIPSGTVANPTRILGKGWDTGCSAKPQLWGTERASSILDLTGSSNVQIQCVDVTDHSSCMEFGPDAATKCNRDTYPHGPWAAIGIVASDSQNVLLKNVNIHGLRSGILAGRLTDWTLENTDIIANSFVGWDGDIGASTSSNSGKIIFRNSRIMWSGCGETYPGLQPHHCYSQDQGGYGDGLGTHQTGGDWVFDHSDISYNVSDGLDLLYHNGNGSITLTHSRFEGNAGNQVKLAANTVIESSKLIGNCGFFKGKSFTSTTDTSFNSVAFNNCRASGSTIAMAFKPGMKAEIYNSTITSNGDGVVLSSGVSCLATDKIVSKNNIYLGGIEFNDGSDLSDLYYASGQYGNGDGPCGQVAFVTSNDVIWGTKYNSTECTGTTSKCVDPKLVGPITFGGDNLNVSLQSNSPAINAATVVSALSATDFNNFDRGMQWDAGALEFGSVPTVLGSIVPPVVEEPLPIFIPPVEPVIDPIPEPAPSPLPPPPPEPVCGDGVIDSGEQCDGANLNSQTCADKGFADGTLNCSSSCAIVTSNCTSCGDGMLDSGEECDGGNLNGQSCSSQGFSSGTLGCTSSCLLNTSSCNNGYCGNGIIDPGEQCDGSKLNSQTCSSQGFARGTLGCTNTCTFNTSSCKISYCGNGIVEPGEQCDQRNHNSQSCTTLGYASGTLKCTSRCQFNTWQCNKFPRRR